MAWSQEQLRNAALITAVGRRMGMSTRDIQIGIITAMVESNLINVNYGDRDSLGLFQQRPSQGWGTPEQVTNPTYAATKFFKALRGLGDRRYQMGMGQAAQAVQRSAFPERYAQRIGDMRKIWPLVQSRAGEQPRTMEDSPWSAENLGLGGAPWLKDKDLGLGTAPEVEAMPPSADMMLGAWGMDAPQPIELDEFSGMGTFIGEHTNQSIIKPMSQEMGDFAKGVDGWRKAVIQYARTALGTPYVWGGNSLANGVDCSGLIMAAFGRAGLNLPRVSYQQANFGKRVGLGQLRPGDLVAWDNSSRNNGADHIALYIGNGMIIEAARPGTVVRTRRIRKGEGAWGVALNF